MVSTLFFFLNVYIVNFKLPCFIQLLKQNVLDQRPLVERLNKTGNALQQLVGEEDTYRIQDPLNKANNEFDHIKNSIRERSNSLDEAFHQTSEVCTVKT